MNYQLLLYNGADLTARGAFGRTALHLSARVGELVLQRRLA